MNRKRIPLLSRARLHAAKLHPNRAVDEPVREFAAYSWTIGYRAALRDAQRQNKTRR